MRRLCSVAVVASVTVALFSAGVADASVSRPGPARAERAVAGIAWGRCSDPSLRKDHAQCGYVSVPLDYRDPHGQQIKIAVSRIKHTATGRHYQGVILENPGGPGGSGLAYDTYIVTTLKAEGYGAATADYDWIGFDPRGVGSSKPAISCIPDYFRPDRPGYVPHSRARVDHWLARAQSYAQACNSASPLQWALLRNMTTRDVAMDIDRIRQALGQKQITYYGISYGTDIGQVYATLFPSHVKRLIMDSNVNPLQDGYHNFNLVQDGPYNRNEDIWLGWIARYHNVYHLGSTESAVRKLFYATEARLAAHPAGGQVGPDEWTDIFIYAAYYQSTWPPLAAAFAVWVHKHSAAAAKYLVELYRGIDAVGYDNGFAVYLSVLCTDSHWPLDWRVWSRDSWALYRKASFAVWWNTWYNAPCLFWPAPSTQPVHVNGSHIKSALLVDETLDAATPFEGSLVVRKLFPHSVLVAEPGGTTHGATLNGDRCIDGTLAAYLETGALPPRKPHAKWDKTCPAPPAPVPPVSPANGHIQHANDLITPHPGGILPLGIAALELPST